jgi:MAS20 protein import receptor
VFPVPQSHISWRIETGACNIVCACVSGLTVSKPSFFIRAKLMARFSTVFAIAGFTVFASLAAYAAYFDYKRRSDPSFRKKLSQYWKRFFWAKTFAHIPSMRRKATQQSGQIHQTRCIGLPALGSHPRPEGCPGANLIGACPTEGRSEGEVFFGKCGCRGAIVRSR